MERHALSLSQLNEGISKAIHEAFPEACWITAEVAEMKVNQRGHCYLELVEKSDDKVVAQMRATLWASDCRRITSAFEKETRETLKAGMKILFLASVNYHEVYGLSLNIRDIDPTYTLGEMARKKKEIIERLTKEGLINLNKEMPFPPVPQRIAVISSPTAAGYQDFFDQLDRNPYGYRFGHVLFPAVMQGAGAEASILTALNEVKKKESLFDVLVFIRGGGSAVDLSCFDSYALCAAAAKFPLPVVTGIGHEKDDTVLDIVAHTRMKTPTAVAEFIIGRVMDFEEQVISCEERMRRFAERLIWDEGHRLVTLGQRLTYLPLQITAAHRSQLGLRERELGNIALQFIRKEEYRVKTTEQAVRLLDPAGLLRRGYSITRYRGKVLRDASALKKWAVIETRLHKGTVTSIVREQKREVKDHEKRKETDLLPGFD